MFLAGILGVIAGWILRETAPPLTTHECQGLLYADTILGIAASGIAFAADTGFSVYLVLRFVVLKVVLTCCGDGVFRNRYAKISLQVILSLLYGLVVVAFICVAVVFSVFGLGGKGVIPEACHYGTAAAIAWSVVFGLCINLDAIWAL